MIIEPSQKITMIDHRNVYSKLRKFKLRGGQSWERIKVIIPEIFKGKNSQKYFASILNVSRMTIARDMEFFINENLINSQRGYYPTHKFISVNAFMEYINPNFWS